MPGLLDQIAHLEGREQKRGEGASVSLFRGAPVQWSEDLARVNALPRRQLDPEGDTRAAEAWTKHLGRQRAEPCDCDTRWGVLGQDGNPVPGSGCILSLTPVQGWALEEASDAKGLWGNVGVGHGKTGMSLLLPMALESKLSVLLIPASVKRQLLEKDYQQWAAHFRVPHLAGVYTWPDRRPVLRVISYSELSLPKNSDILTREGVADLIIADEAHNLKDRKGTRWRRLTRAFEVQPFRFVALTGTPSDKSIKEYAHLMGLTLGEKAPIARHPPVVDEWALALDAGEQRAPAGALAKLCGPGETVQEGFARRVAETHGCIVTSTASVHCELSVTAIKAPEIPHEPLPGIGRTLEQLIAGTRAGERPDGEQAMDLLTSAMWGRQLAAGFYSYWNFPRGEPDELIERWLKVRKAYAKEVRKKLQRPAAHADSPLLLWNAATRWHDGFAHDGKQYPPRTKDGPLPTWDSAVFPEWRAVKDTVYHETRYRWVSDYLVDATAEWASKNVGIVWVTHKDFGRRVAEKLGLPFYDGGKKNPEFEERGNRSAVLSIKGNLVGRNLQRLWHRALYPTPFPSNQAWEQSLGRIHRKGQPKEEVFAETFLHTAEMRRAFDVAQSRAHYVQATQRQPQKLCYAHVDLTYAVEDPEGKPTSTASGWFESVDDE